MLRATEYDMTSEEEPLAGSFNRFAAEAIAFAVQYCKSRLASTEEVAELLKQNNGMAHDYFRYGLATRVAQYLSEADTNVKAVYVCNWDELPDETGAELPGITSPLSLIVCVARKTAALKALLVGLDVAITLGYKDIVGPEAGKLTGLLDAHVVDDDEINRRVGYGAAITSIHARPNRVWWRQSM